MKYETIIETLIEIDRFLADRTAIETSNKYAESIPVFNSEGRAFGFMPVYEREQFRTRGIEISAGYIQFVMSSVATYTNIGSNGDLIEDSETYRFKFDELRKHFPVLYEAVDTLVFDCADGITDLDELAVHYATKIATKPALRDQMIADLQIAKEIHGGVRSDEKKETIEAFYQAKDDYGMF